MMRAAQRSGWSAWFLGALLAFGLLFGLYLIRFGDPRTVRRFMRRSSDKVVDLKDALNELVAAFPQVSQSELPECARIKILEIRRVLRTGECTEETLVPSQQRPSRAAKDDDEDDDDDEDSKAKRARRSRAIVASKEVVLSGEERLFLKALMRMPAASLSATQRDALDAVQESSPLLFARLQADVKREAVAAALPPTTTAALGDVPVRSGFSRTGGHGLQGFTRKLLLDPNSATNNAIFVALVSYRDPQCGDSLFDAFARAANPARVFIGVVQQNRDTDLDCFETYCRKAGKACRPLQVRVVRMKDSEAQGVMYARWLASSLWNGERWYLQVDAHSSFNYEWDDMVIKSILSTGDERAVLSHHPPDMKQWPNSMGDSVINICRYKWDDGGLPRFSSIMASKRWQNITKPFPGIFIGAGMVFGRAQWVVDCPFDPHLTFMFSGEELLLSVCLFTKGWNLYNPDTLPVWHFYTRNIAGRENPSVGHLRDKAILRLKYLLGVVDASAVPRDFLRNIDPYLMGNVRSRDDYWKYAGIDWDKKPVNEPFCETITYGSDKAKQKFYFHYQPQSGLLPLAQYFFDTVPTVPPRYRSTAAPYEQFLTERKMDAPQLPDAQPVQH